MGAAAGADWGVAADISSMEATASSTTSSVGVEKRANFVTDWVAMGAKAVTAVEVVRMVSFIIAGYY